AEPVNAPSKPSTTSVPSGGFGSHCTSPRTFPTPARHPRTATRDDPVTEEPFSLRRIALRQLASLSLDTGQVRQRPRHARVVELKNPAPLTKRRPTQLRRRLTKIPLHIVRARQKRLLRDAVLRRVPSVRRLNRTTTHARKTT